MSGSPLRVVGSGAITSVGFCAASTAAAMRCRLSRYEEVEVVSGSGVVVAAAVQDERCPVGQDAPVKLGRWMAEAALQACASHFIDMQRLPVVSCMMETARPGREPDWERKVVHAFVELFGRPHPSSRVCSGGSMAIVDALSYAHRLLYGDGHDAVLLTAADTWLLDASLQALADGERAKDEDSPDGMVPGEAAAALLLTRADDDAADADAESLYICGWALADEPARLDNDIPNLAFGLCAALRAALSQAGQDGSDVDLVLPELGPEPFYANEATAAAVRVFQGCIRAPQTWLTAESLGDTGAAAPLLAACWLREAHTRDYHPGFNSVWHAAADDGRRAAVAFTWL